MFENMNIKSEFISIMCQTKNYILSSKTENSWHYMYRLRQYKVIDKLHIQQNKKLIKKMKLSCRFRIIQIVVYRVRNHPTKYLVYTKYTIYNVNIIRGDGNGKIEYKWKSVKVNCNTLIFFIVHAET